MNGMLHQLTWVAATAAALGILMLRLKQPPMLGFMLAGLALGPTGIRLVSNDESVRLFAELGVLLLLFVVGLEISLRSLKRLLAPAAACALIQAAAALLVTVAIGALLGWPPTQSLVIGFVLSISSTAAGIKLLESVGEARRESGRLAVSVLVAQDVLVIPMLLIIGSLGAVAVPGLTLAARIVIAVGVLIGLIALLSRRERLKAPFAAALARDADAGPLAALAVCLLGATAASLLGVSPIYGAFVAGLIVGASNLRASALRVSIPVQSVLLMVFFLSIGLMLDLRALLPMLPALLLISIAVLGARTAVNAVALRLLKAPPREALLAAVAMAPLGEFGFVLAAAGLSAGALTADGYQMALAVIAISMAASPLWMLAARRAVEHRETEAVTVRAFAAEIFADEMAAARRWTERAGIALRTGATLGAAWSSDVAGVVVEKARAAAKRARPRPANDQDIDDDPSPDGHLRTPPPPDVPASGPDPRSERG
jgi:CPA2 family monovalent cation:H+ antiporter-2